MRARIQGRRRHRERRLQHRLVGWYGANTKYDLFQRLNAGRMREVIGRYWAVLRGEGAADVGCMRLSIDTKSARRSPVSCGGKTDQVDEILAGRSVVKYSHKLLRGGTAYF
jgi:hypothetical protein